MVGHMSIDAEETNRVCVGDEKDEVNVVMKQNPTNPLSVWIFAFGVAWRSRLPLYRQMMQRPHIKKIIDWRGGSTEGLVAVASGLPQN